LKGAGVLVPNALNILGLPIKLQELPVKNKLPLIVTSDYDFFKGQILNQDCLILHFKGQYLSIPRVQKHFDTLPAQLGISVPCILWLDEVSAIRRKRLIENHISFFVDEKMVFIPFLGTRLETRPEKVRKPLPEKFSTATQCVFLWLLYHSTPECPIAQIMNDLHLSQATVARALLLLQQHDLLIFQGKATRKQYFRIDAKQFWENGKKHLQSPVGKRLFMEDMMPLLDVEIFTSGEEALANMSMLQKPQHECRAVYKKHFDKLKVSAVESAELLYSEDYAIVEIWNYDPGLFAQSYIDNAAIYDDVDLFSLYASLENLLDDVRIEAEIEDLVEDYFNGPRD
jgi:hypothetical protein